MIEELLQALEFLLTLMVLPLNFIIEILSILNKKIEINK